MRLICPNCGAQYAVDLRVIPAAGRDVQCSACGFTWFQVHPSQDDGLSEELGHEQPSPLPEVGAETEDLPDRTENMPPRDTGTAPGAQDTAEAQFARRPVDPGVMSVLREEAEREQAARRAELAGLEMQGDLDLEPPPPSSVRRAMPADSSPTGRTVPPHSRIGDEERALRPAPRRDLLPDIEEINSTLQPGSASEDAAPAPDIHQLRAARVRRRQGRRIGFGLACAVFTLLTVLYTQGDRIGEAVPAFGPSLSTYVTKVESVRFWLDDVLRSAAGSQQGPGVETEPQ